MNEKTFDQPAFHDTSWKSDKTPWHPESNVNYSFKNTKVKDEYGDPMLEEYDIFTGQPDGDPCYGGGHHLLTDREREEAWCHYREGQQYSVYFPEGGDVGLELPDGNYTVRWLNIEQSRWTNKRQVDGGINVSLSTAGEGHWLALVTKKD
jgi:hypothetical protein